MDRSNKMVEFETNNGTVRGEPLFAAEVVEVNGGDTATVEWKVPEGIKPMEVQWVLLQTRKL